MKVAPVLNALRERENEPQTLVLAGQHYDVSMSHVFIPATRRTDAGH